MIKIKTIRTKKLQDLINNNIDPVVSTDLDNEFHWEVADIHKEAFGIKDKNIIKDYPELPGSADPGTLIRVNGKIYRWEND